MSVEVQSLSGNVVCRPSPPLTHRSAVPPLPRAGERTEVRGGGRADPAGAAPCILSIDVEDWFHVLDLPGAPELSQWDVLPSRVEKNTLRLLDLLSESNTQATFFFLGWVAGAFPGLVREVAGRGHEVASHGYAHRLVYELTPREFREDAARAKAAIEDAAGLRVVGYRAPGFSVTEKTPWFFEELAAAGYVYDSSVFPAVRNHGGLRSAPMGPYRVVTSAGDVIEFPVTVATVFGRRVCFFGGGYLRLAPYRVVTAMAGKVWKEKRPVIFYLHPREIDPGHPRLPMSFGRRFRCYVNLRSTEAKLRRIAARFRPAPYRDYMANNESRGSAELPAFGNSAACP